MTKIEGVTSKKLSGTQLLLIGFIVVLGLVLIGWFANRIEMVSWDFRNNLWAPTALLVDGRSPFDVTPLYPDGRAVWLPYVVGIFFPLGWVSFPYASLLWLVLNIGLILVLVIVAANGEKPRVVPFALGLVVIFLHPRVVAHLGLGQYSIFATALFLLAAYLLPKKKTLLTAIIVIIALAKPQLGFLIVPGFIVANYRLFGLKEAGKFILYLMLVSLLFLLPLFIGYPNWIPDFLRSMQANPGWAQPSLLSVLQSMIGFSGFVVWFILAIVFSIVNVWLWWRFPTTDAIYWSLALTPLITPYVWSWDFVMMMPLFVRTMYELKSIPSYLVLLGGYVVLWIGMFQVLINTDGNDQYFVWVSWATFLLILVVLAIEKKNGNQPQLIENFGKA